MISVLFLPRLSCIHQHRLGSILGPVDGSNVGVAGSLGCELVAAVGVLGEVVELGALRNQVDGRAALRDVLVVLVAAVGGSEGGVGVFQSDVLGAVVRHGVVAGNEGAGARGGGQVRVRVGEPGQASAGAGAAVDAHSVLVRVQILELGLVLDVDSIGNRRSSSVGEYVRVAITDVLGGAVEVEGAAWGRGGIKGLEDSHVAPGARVCTLDDPVLDRRREVTRRVGDIGDELEALRLRCGRVVWYYLAFARGGSCRKSCKAESDDGSVHYEGCGLELWEV